MIDFSTDDGIRQAMREIADWRPPTDHVNDQDDAAPSDVELPTKPVAPSISHRSSRSKSRFTLAFAGAAAIVVLGVVGLATQNRPESETQVASGHQEDLGTTYRFSVETSVSKSDTSYEDPARQEAEDAKAEPGKGPSAEGKVDLNADRASMQLVVQHDGLFDRLLEPSDPYVIFREGNTTLTLVAGQAIPGIGAPESEAEFGPLFPEATKTLDRLNLLLEDPEWIELGAEEIDGTPTTHLRANLTGMTGGQTFSTDSLIAFSEIFEQWEGHVDVWLRDDGLAARVIIVVDENGGVDTLQLDYHDYGVAVDIERPAVKDDGGEDMFPD